MRFTLTLGALVLGALVTTSAYADPDAEQEASAAMRRGISAFGRGDPEAALIEYETAKRLAPHANVPYLYAGEALVSLGRYEDAVHNLEGYISQNPDVSDAASVRARIAKIKAEHYAGSLDIITRVDEAVVSVDGEPRGQTRKLSLAPGRHHVELRAPGHEAASQEIVVEGDRTATLIFALSETTPARLPAGATEGAAVPWRTVGWVAAGVGAGALLAGIIVDGAALGPKIDDYRAAASRSDPSARDLHDDVSLLRDVAIAGYVTGSVLLTGGLGLALFGPRPARVAIAPWMTPSSAGLGVLGAL